MVASPDPRMRRMDGSELRGDVAVALAADSSSILAAVSGLDGLKAGLAGTWSARAAQSLGAGVAAPSRLGDASGWGSGAVAHGSSDGRGGNDSRVHAAWASMVGGRAASDTESDVSLDDDDATLPLHGAAAVLPARHFEVLLPTPAGMLTSEQQRARAVMEAASAQRRAARSPSPRPSARRTLAMTEEPRYPSP
eukprot:COSAG04_NODE_4744_length_1915_cov_3.098568_3_plen_193_part_01